MPQIYYCDTAKFDPLYEKMLENLPEERKRKAEGFLHGKDRLLSAAAGLMVIKIFGKDAFEKILYNEHGKPFFEQGKKFSISHSGRFSVIAVSEEEIGIDIEAREIINPAVAKRCFTEEEQDFAKMSTQNFLRIWTAKEAVLKLLGTGFSYSPSNFSVLPLDEKHCIEEKNIRFYCDEIDDFPLTAAFCGKDDDFEIREFLPEDLLS